MSNMRFDYEHNKPIVSLIDDWSPPQPPKIRCDCGTILRRTNPDKMCESCKRKLDKERK